MLALLNNSSIENACVHPQYVCIRMGYNAATPVFECSDAHVWDYDVRVMMAEREIMNSYGLLTT